MLLFNVRLILVMHFAAAFTRPVLLPNFGASAYGTACRRAFRCSSTVRSASSYPPDIILSVPTANDMEDVGGLLASLLLEKGRPEGAIVCLEGDLGAGKTAFARGFVRGATGDWNLRVTSPTYLLSNTYRAAIIDRNDTESAIEIHHMDLYRLNGNPEDFTPLNLDKVFRDCISLIEWPVRLSTVSVPTSHLLEVDIRLLSSLNEDEEDNPRRLTLSYPEGSSWRSILDQIRQEGLLDDMLTLTA